MEKYFKRTSSLEIGSQNNLSTSSNKRRFLEVEVESLIADTGQRPKISSYHPNDRDKAKKNYQIHLTATIDCIRFLLRQGLAFRGNDETDDSVNQENFLELLNFLAQHNEEIDRAFKNVRGNLKLRAPSIKKDIVRAAACETTKAVVNDLGDELFAVLVDEACDISIKEQMSVCLSIGVIIRNI
ncbi:zinc finger MYM-type protein 1-like [Arachis ipaensis]|uniref:zinc finger MYM-type protein 1-like n=1 Tax=Arachis ipaensis TaxID=130454 RepID=UPI000A2B5F61|nr:zinc finger MYM-type protein 1-like [Arachis ipaensis]